MLVGVGETDLFEDAIDGSLDLFDVCLGEGFVLTPGLSGMYRFEVFG